MVDPRARVSDPEETRRWFYKDMQRAVLLGSVLWLGITDHLERYPDEYRVYARRALEFRKALQPLLKIGCFSDNLFVQKVSDGCDACCWKLNDGRILFIAGNHELRQDVQAEFILPKKIRQADAYDTDGNQVPVKIQENRILLAMDTERLFRVIVELE